MDVIVKSSNSINYESQWACAFDFSVESDTVIEPGEMKLVETGVVIKVPQWTALLVLERSSTYKKFKVGLANKVGLIDNDYCGDNDTIKLAVINYSNDTVTLEKGTRIAQWLFVSIEKPNFIYVDKMSETDRWGFGSTGTN